MFSNSKESIVIFVVCVVILLALLCTFIITVIFKYQQRQIAFFKELEQIKAEYENTLLQSHLEMQEQTLQHIAREIHDNIGQKLTLAKLYLNTLAYQDSAGTATKVGSSLDLISFAINDLSDISKSMSTDLIINNGLVKVIEIEAEKLQSSGIFQVDFIVKGREIFLDTNKEVVMFRIVQEALNNIVKHACARTIIISLIYSEKYLTMQITDDGKGFDTNEKKAGAGLINIQKRTAHLQGSSAVSSNETGTTITIKIPINEITTT